MKLNRRSLAFAAVVAWSVVPTTIGCQSASDESARVEQHTTLGPDNPCWSYPEMLPGMIPVIGRQWDVEPFKNDPRYCVLDLDDWSPAANRRWIDSVATVRPPYIVVASQITADKLWNPERGSPAVFFDELIRLRDLGYDLPAGQITLPDGSVAPFAPSERRILLDPFAPPGAAAAAFTADDAKKLLRRAANLAIPAALLAGVIGELTGVVDPETGRLLADAASCADAFREVGPLVMAGSRGLTNLTIKSVQLVLGCTGVLARLGVDTSVLDGPLGGIARCASDLAVAGATLEIPIANLITGVSALSTCLNEVIVPALQDTVFDRALTQLFGFDYWRDGVPRDLFDRPYVPGLALEYQPTVVIAIEGDFEQTRCIDSAGAIRINTDVVEFPVPWETFVRFLLGQAVSFEKHTDRGVKRLAGARLDAVTLRTLRMPGADQITRLFQKDADSPWVFQYKTPEDTWAAIISAPEQAPPPPCPPDPPPPPAPRCGNGIREGSETCDGYDMCSGPVHQCTSDCTQCVCNDTSSPGPECGTWTDLCGQPRDNGDPCAARYGSPAYYCEGNRCECEDSSGPPSGDCYAGYHDACGDYVPGKTCSDPRRPVCDYSMNQCYGACDDSTCAGLCHYCGFDDGWCTDYTRPADSISSGCYYTNCYCHNYF